MKIAENWLNFLNQATQDYVSFFIRTDLGEI